MNTRKMLEQVFAAQQDAWAADQLVRAYLPFIRSETAKFIHRIPQEGIDDELSIAMFAFHEAVMAYQKDRGSFVSFASLIIRNRLIDFQRRRRKTHLFHDGYAFRCPHQYDSGSYFYICLPLGH